MAKRPADLQNNSRSARPTDGVKKPVPQAPSKPAQTHNLPDNHVIVGVIGAAHGLRGEVRLKSYTEDPMALGDYGPLRLPDGRLMRVKVLRLVRDDLVIARLEGIADRTAAEQLTGLPLSLDRTALPALEDEDEFYHADLVGLKAVDAQGEVLGHIVGLFNYGAGDMLEIRLNKPAPSDFLPFTKAFVPNIDLKAGWVEVALPDDFAKPATPQAGRNPQSKDKGSGQQAARKAKGTAAS
jgi:16S rRNA processing protein RimM